METVSTSSTPTRFRLVPDRFTVVAMVRFEIKSLKKNHWCLLEISGARVIVPLPHPEGKKQPNAAALMQ